MKKGRYSGGISLYYKNCLKDKIKIIEKHQCGVIWVKILQDIFSFEEDVYICHSYIPPKGSKVLNDEEIDIFEIIEEGIVRYKNLGKLFVTGDLNSRTSNELDFLDFDKYLEEEDDFVMNETLLRVSKDHVIDTYGRRLLLLCQATNLLIANGRFFDDSNIGEFTFVTKNGFSVVDYVLSSQDDILCLNNFQILEQNEFSDHAPILLSFPRKSDRHPNGNASNETSRKVKIVYEESKRENFRSLILNCVERIQTLTDDLNNEPVDNIVASFTELMYEQTCEVFGKPVKQTQNTNKNRNKWFNIECAEAQNDFKRKRNTYLKDKNAINRENFVQARTKYNKVKRNAKYKYKIQEGKNLCKKAKTQPKQFWKSIKDKFKKKSNQSETITANDLLNHFENVYGGNTNTRTQQQDQSLIDETETILNPELDSEITNTELLNAIMHQKNNKSPGIDNLIVETLKISFDIISPFLLKLFNRLFSNGEYPKAWGEGIIVPIFKGGDKDDAHNYRGITLINILSKIYSQVLHNRLTNWSDRENKISNNQFGFQKGKSTVDCIFIFSSIISKTLSTGNKLYCAFLDYEKAFDKIDRSLLWHKLLAENVSSKLVKALKSMYDTENLISLNIG